MTQLLPCKVCGYARQLTNGVCSMDCASKVIDTLTRQRDELLQLLEYRIDTDLNMDRTYDEEALLKRIKREIAKESKL